MKSMREVEEVVKEWTYFEREPPKIGRPSRIGISWLALFVGWVSGCCWIWRRKDRYIYERE